MCIPSFLSKYAETIATIGKTIKVLGYLIHQENLYLYLSKVKYYFCRELVIIKSLILKRNFS